MDASQTSNTVATSKFRHWPRFVFAATLMLSATSHSTPGRQAALDDKPVTPLWESLKNEAPGLDATVLRLALEATRCAARRRIVEESKLLTVIDYSLPSTRPRLWVLDLQKREVLFRELVAHGKGSGENHTERVSNLPGSRQSSLGLFLTERAYTGRNGYSLKLHGLEEGFNHRAHERAIVIHGAWYVSSEFAKKHGRLGRSWGCPAVPTPVARQIIDTIQGGTLVFVYFPDEEWIRSSEFLGKCPSPESATPQRE